MSFLSAVKSMPVVTGTIDPRSSSKDYWLFGVGPNNSDVHISFGSLNDCIKAYECCPPVSTIINRKAESHTNGKVWILNTQGKAKEKEAGGEVAARIRKVMSQPNPLQDWTSFDAMVKVYVQLFGYCPVLRIRPTGFDGSYTTRSWILPPFLLDIQESEDLFYRTDKPIKTITLNYKNKKTDLTPFIDDIFFIKDFSPNPSSYYLPQSKIKVLAQPINNVIGSLKSRGVLVARRGALGILSNFSQDSAGHVPLDETEKEEVQKEMMRYGLQHDQFQVIVTNAALKWQQMGYPMKELGLFEEVQESTMTICDGLGYIYRLLSSNNINSLGGTDVREFRALLYEQFIIPEALRIYEQYNVMFDAGKYNLRIEKDFSEVPALQKDASTLATALFTRNKAFQIAFGSNACTINEWRIKNGDDPITATAPAEGGDTIDWPNMYYFQLVQAGFKFAGLGGNSGGATDPNQNPNNQNNNNGSNNNA